MIDIAIIEECDEDADRLVRVLDEYAAQHGLEFCYRRERSGREFLAARDRRYRVVFLDTNGDGIETARIYRAAGGMSAIVFVTRDLIPAAKSYEVDALDYIIKPVTLKRLSLRLARAFTGGAKKNVVIREKSGPVQLSADDIHYVEIHGHLLTWHTEEGDFSENGSMKLVREELAPYGFALCNACYLVNLRHAYRVNGYFLTMTSGDVLKISQPKRKDFLTALRNS